MRLCDRISKSRFAEKLVLSWYSKSLISILFLFLLPFTVVIINLVICAQCPETSATAAVAVWCLSEQSRPGRRNVRPNPAPSPQTCGPRGAGGERKWGKALSGEEQPPRCAAARAGTTVGVLLQSSSTCSSFFQEVKLQPNVVLSKCKVMCLHCRSDVFVFFVHFSLIWSVAILLTDQTHCPLLLQCEYSSIYIYMSHGRLYACIGAQECIHLYIAHATVFTKL